MKRTKMLLGLAISFVAFMLITPVFASPYLGSGLDISNNGRIWRASLKDISTVSGNDVTGAVASYYWNDTSVVPEGVPAGPVSLTFTRMQKSNDGITLSFDRNVIQGVTEEVVYTVVDMYGSDNGDNVLLASVQGPAFAWGRTR